jgi:hypothetical protein
VSAEFQYDVFLSHSSKDKVIVRTIAERLRSDGLRVWFDDWEIRPGDSIPAKIEEGLEHSRVLVLCMSASAFGSEWAQLESHTFRFRDPLNKERRFIPLRLDGTPVKGSLAQFLHINWLQEESKQEYGRLIEACRPVATEAVAANLLPETLSPLGANSAQDTSVEISEPSVQSIPMIPRTQSEPARCTIEPSTDSNRGLTKLEINKVVNRYIGVSAGYLCDFSYQKHRDFYLDLDLDIDPDSYTGTTRARFIQILSQSRPDVQARILSGILDKYPVGSSELRTQERHDEIAAWIARLNA